MNKNPFEQIKASNRTKRGRGLGSPPKPREAGRNVALPEHAPAVAASAPRRHYRISTYLSDESGERFERLHAQLRLKEGRKVKQAEVLEMALEKLERALKR